jgi:hypothetical protein
MLRISATRVRDIVRGARSRACNQRHCTQ